MEYFESPPEFLESVNIASFFVAEVVVYLVALIFSLALVRVVSVWVLLEKANKPGWSIFIPIYNVLVLLQVVRKPWWWLLLLMIPFVNVVVAVFVMIELARAFGKSGWACLGLMFLPSIFYPIFAFSDAEYVYGDLSVR